MQGDKLISTTNFISEMNILKLTLKKKWFDLILSGEKTEEYREIKKYWIDRLTHKYNTNCENEPIKYKQFDAVKFFNGAYYSEKLPNFVIECRGISKSCGKKEWGALSGIKYFKIKLGDIIDNNNC